MKEITWEAPGCVAIDAHTRTQWAQQYANTARKQWDSNTTFTNSGDSIVVATKDPDTGIVEIFDCLIRRQVTIYVNR